jgi:hypothetical protein
VQVVKKKTAGMPWAKRIGATTSWTSAKPSSKVRRKHRLGTGCSAQWRDIRGDRGVRREELHIRFELPHASKLEQPAHVRHVAITYHVVIRKQKI